jgi:hypothetical protein
MVGAWAAAGKTSGGAELAGAACTAGGAMPEAAARRAKSVGVGLARQTWPQCLQRTVRSVHSSGIRTAFLQPGHFVSKVADIDSISAWRELTRLL